MDSNRILIINEMDHVGVALSPLKEGEKIKLLDRDIRLKDSIKVGHKLALMDIAKGQDIIKYGAAIGHAKGFIEAGSHVHSHNLATNLKGLISYSYEADFKDETRDREIQDKRTFSGYRRPNGSAAIRNEIWIINTVGCVNGVAERLVRLARDRFKGRAIDAISTFVHPHGCSQLGDDHRNTQDILARLVNHPNAGGVLVLGLGCENNQISSFKEIVEEMEPINDSRVKFLITQEVDDEEEVALELLEELVDYAEGFKREPIGIEELIVGLKCGGSDAFSGITGNPLLGAFSDKLIGLGGTSILTEVPEMFGAETILMNRSIDETVFHKTVAMINNFKEYFLNHGQEVYENPSPGNKEGGITTLEEKSLGCTQKGGNSLVIDVLEYGGAVKKKGLNLLDGPGNDIVATTALTAAGAHVVLFTTGRGTPLGGPVPTVKISTNSDLARRKKNWIDFDSGSILDGKAIDEIRDEFFDYIVDLASGKLRSRNEEYDYKEIAIFKDGVTL